MDLLTVDETAALLRVSPITIRRFIASGRLPARRVGRHIRVEREAAEALAEPVSAGEQTPPDTPSQPDWLRQALRPMTEEEIAQTLAALKQAEEHAAEMRAEHGGELFPESWPLIREDREERARQIEGL